MILTKLNNDLIHFADDHPVLAGVLTPAATILISFIGQIEIWMRLGVLGLGLAAGSLTVYAKWLHVKNIKKDK